MHPVRRNILFRWIGYLVVIAATVAWVYAGEHEVPKFHSNVKQRLAPKGVDIPSEDVTDTIRRAITVVEGKRPAYAAVKTINPSLVMLEEEAGRLRKEGGMGVVNVSTIFMGPPVRFAVLNGLVRKEGEKLPDGRVVKKIEKDAVILAVGDARQRVAWIPPFKVELKKPEKEEKMVFRPEEKTPEAEKEGKAKAETREQMEQDLGQRLKKYQETLEKQ